jgi:hypothetical protein
LLDPLTNLLYCFCASGRACMWSMGRDWCSYPMWYIERTAAQVSPHPRPWGSRVRVILSPSQSLSLSRYYK